MPCLLMLAIHDAAAHERFTPAARDVLMLMIKILYESRKSLFLLFHFAFIFFADIFSLNSYHYYHNQPTTT